MIEFSRSCSSIVDYDRAVLMIDRDLIVSLVLSVPGRAGKDQCSQRGSPSVLSQDEDGRQCVVPTGHFLKLPDK